MGCGATKSQVEGTSQPSKESKGGEDWNDPEIMNEFHGEASNKKGEAKSRYDRDAGKPEENDMFGVQEQSGGEQFAAVKPWLGALVAPTHEPSNHPNEPAEGLQLEYVNGYRSEDARNNLFFTKKPNEVVFMAGAIGVLFDVKKNTQSFLGAGEKKSANGHTDDIVSLAVTRDRTLLATGQVGEKPLVCIWDLASGSLKTKFSLGRGMRACKSLVWSSDNKRVIACALDNDHTIFGLNPESGATLWSDKFGGDPVFDIDSCSGSFDFGCVGKRDVCLFDKEGKKKKALFGQNVKMAPQLAISFFDQGDKFVTGSSEGLLYLWDNCQAQKTFPIHTGSVQVLTIINGKIYSSGNDKKLNVWDTNVKQLSSYELPHYAKAIDVQGETIIAGTRNGCIVEIENNKINVVMNGHSDGEVWGLAVCPNTGNIITTCDDNKIVLFDPLKHKTIKTGVVNAVAGQKKKIGGASTLSAFPPNQCARSAAISKKGHVAIGVNSGEVHIFENSGLEKKIKTLTDSKEWVEFMAYSPDDESLAVGSHDNNIYVYSTKDYSLKATCSAHKSFITSLDWSADSKNIQSNCGAYEYLFHDAQTGKQIPSGATKLRDEEWATFSCKLGWPVQGVFPPGVDGSHVNGVDRNPSKSLLATGDDWGMVNIYNYPCLKDAKSRVFRAHSSHVVRVKFSNNGEHVYSVGGFDSTLMIWKLTK